MGIDYRPLWSYRVLRLRIEGIGFGSYACRG